MYVHISYNFRFHWAKENPRTIQIIDGMKETPFDFVHRVFGDRMQEFFDALENLTEGVSVNDINAIFSNRYLDEVFRPQWERFGVNLPSYTTENEENNAMTNEIFSYNEIEKPKIQPNSSECCAIN